MALLPTSIAAMVADMISPANARNSTPDSRTRGREKIARSLSVMEKFRNCYRTETCWQTARSRTIGRELRACGDLPQSVSAPKCPAEYEQCQTNANVEQSG